MTLPGAREVRAPRGTCRITARSWQTEAPLRMLLMNNLDPEVAERPDDLVYGTVAPRGHGRRTTRSSRP
ncbi:MAG: hypothetical protein R2693_02635 [Nocardioidaceae bacterium]